MSLLIPKIKQLCDYCSVFYGIIETECMWNKLVSEISKFVLS